MEETPELISLLGDIEMLQIDEQDEHEKEINKKKGLKATLFEKLDIPTPARLRSEIKDKLVSFEGLPVQTRKLFLKSLV